MTMDETESAGRKSSTGAQIAPPSFVRQMPPPAVPAKIVDGFVGCTTSVRTRPPTFAGPSDRHAVRDIAEAPVPAAAPDEGAAPAPDEPPAGAADAAPARLAPACTFAAARARI